MVLFCTLVVATVAGVYYFRRLGLGMVAVLTPNCRTGLPVTSNGEHSYGHVVDNQERLCEVDDRGVFGSDLTLSEYGPAPSPALGCQPRSIDIHLTPRRRRRAYNAGQ